MSANVLEERDLEGKGDLGELFRSAVVARLAATGAVVTYVQNRDVREVRLAFRQVFRQHVADGEHSHLGLPAGERRDVRYVVAVRLQL